MLSKSARARVLQRAADAWRVGRPHRAWRILAEAGMEELWPEFQRVALRYARQRYEKRLAAYTE